MANSSLSPHDQRQVILESMAILAGYSTALPHFPDGTTPDVLRVRLQEGSAFIGDAKDTETPRNTATLVRLTHYFRWAKSIRNSGQDVSFLLCIPPGRKLAADWLNVIFLITKEIKLPCQTSGATRLSSDSALVWVTM